MPILNLGRVRPVFRGDFGALDGETMTKYDVVTHAGSAWFYISDTDTTANVNVSTGNHPGTASAVGLWNEIAKGVEVVGDYDNNNTYFQNQIVTFGSSSYIARQKVPAGSFNTPGVATSFWQEFATGFGRFANEYQDNLSYGTGSIVTFKGSTFIADTSILPDGTGAHRPDRWLDWELVAQGYYFAGEWTQAIVSNTHFGIGTVVSYRGSAYVVTNRLGAANTKNPATSPEYTKLFEGITLGHNPDNTLMGFWDSSTTYYEGELVTYLNAIYIANRLCNAGEIPGAVSSNPGWTEVLALDTRYIEQKSKTSTRVRYRFIGY